MQFFDVQSKTWKSLPSIVQPSEATAYFCAEYVGNYMYVAAKRGNDFVNYRITQLITLGRHSHLLLD